MTDFIFCDWCDRESRPNAPHFPAPAPYAQASICKDCLDFIVQNDRLGSRPDDGQRVIHGVCNHHDCGRYDDVRLARKYVRGTYEWDEWRCPAHRKPTSRHDPDIFDIYFPRPESGGEQ